MNRSQFVTILVITFIVGMIWLISDIVFNTKASIPPNPKQEALLQPVNPEFSTRVLDAIDQDVIDSSSVRAQITNPAPIASPSKTPIPTPTPLSSRTPSPSPSRTASSSAIITPLPPVSTQSGQL